MGIYFTRGGELHIFLTFTFSYFHNLQGQYYNLDLTIIVHRSAYTGGFTNRRPLKSR